MNKVDMRMGGYLSQNGVWISYKTGNYNSELKKINALASDFLAALDEDGIQYELDSLRVAKAKLSKHLVLMIKSGDTTLPYEQSPIN